MTDVGWAAVGEVFERLKRDCAKPGDFRSREPAGTAELVRALFAVRQRFGITRLGSLTRLERAGVSVVQAIRPLSLSNAVATGKGLSQLQAAASALMEALETWAAERVPETRVTTARACDLGDEIRTLYAGSLVHSFDAGWDRLLLGWIEAYDLFTARALPVPMALVDTVYTLPSPHPVAFPRTTTGLAGGATLLSAVIHAALEILERASVATAERRSRSLGERPVDADSVQAPLSSEILSRLRAADLVAGIWLVPTEHSLPVFRCHVIEGEEHREIAPLPGEGFGCDFSHDHALAKALLEASQARVTAIAGTREDLTRQSYPERYDRKRLTEWRNLISAPPRAVEFPNDGDAPAFGEAALDRIVRALEAAGARAALLVPLFTGVDPSLEVVRMVAPPLRHANAA
jgi:ribosomal protein S12 methylthiotransferase accessory factor